MSESISVKPQGAAGTCIVLCKTVEGLESTTAPTNEEVSAAAAENTCCFYSWTNPETGDVYMWWVDAAGDAYCLKGEPGASVLDKQPVPLSAFADPANPTNAEFEVWVAANGAIETTYCYGGSLADPDYIWQYNELNGTWLNYESPSTSIENVIVPDTAFADPTTPTEAEVQAWLIANGYTDVVYAHVAGSSTNPTDPDYSFFFDGSTTINTNEPESSTENVVVPATAFADPNNPTPAEVQTWLLANGYTANDTVYAHVAGNSTDPSDPDYSYFFDGSSTYNTNEPSTPITDKVVVPTSAFLNPLEPTEAEFVAWVTANGNPNTTYCYGGTISNPDHVWEYNSVINNWVNYESPASPEQAKVVIPDATFTDLTDPLLTQTEFNAYLAANPATNTRFCTGGTTTGTDANPDYVWDVDNDGDSTNIECYKPTFVDYITCPPGDTRILSEIAGASVRVTAEDIAYSDVVRGPSLGTSVILQAALAENSLSTWDLWTMTYTNTTNCHLRVHAEYWQSVTSPMNAAGEDYAYFANHQLLTSGGLHNNKIEASVNGHHYGIPDPGVQFWRPWTGGDANNFNVVAPGGTITFTSRLRFRSIDGLDATRNLEVYYGGTKMFAQRVYEF